MVRGQRAEQCRGKGALRRRNWVLPRVQAMDGAAELLLDGALLLGVLLITYFPPLTTFLPHLFR